MVLFYANGCVCPYISNMYLSHRVAVFVTLYIIWYSRKVTTFQKVDLFTFQFQGSHSKIAEDSGHSLRDIVSWTA